VTTAIFDLDGTLADTSLDLLAAANACFPAPVLDPVRDRATAFEGGRAMLRAGFDRLGRDWSEADVEAAYPRLLAHYAEAIAVETRLFPGAAAALDGLAAAGWRLGVCTLKPEGLAHELLTRLAVRDRFHALSGADTRPWKKPDPRHLTDTIAAAGGDPARAVLVGDSATDRRTAAAAGVPCILVTFRPAGLDVAAMAPEGLLGHYDGLADALAAVLSR